MDISNANLPIYCCRHTSDDVHLFAWAKLAKYHLQVCWLLTHNQLFYSAETIKCVSGQNVGSILEAIKFQVLAFGTKLPENINTHTYKRTRARACRQLSCNIAKTLTLTTMNWTKRLLKFTALNGENTANWTEWGKTNKQMLLNSIEKTTRVNFPCHLAKGLNYGHCHNFNTTPLSLLTNADDLKRPNDINDLSLMQVRTSFNYWNAFSCRCTQSTIHSLSVCQWTLQPNECNITRAIFVKSLTNLMSSSKILHLALSKDWVEMFLCFVTTYRNFRSSW